VRLEPQFFPLESSSHSEASTPRAGCASAYGRYFGNTAKGKLLRLLAWAALDLPA
jgi:hypothetical protein